MLSRKTCRITAFLMLMIAAVFFVFAVTHPTASFPWSNTITYSMYAVYLLIMLLLFAAPHRRGKKDRPQ